METKVVMMGRVSAVNRSGERERGGGYQKKKGESWGFSHVEVFFGVARLQKANRGIRQYRATVKDPTNH